MGVRRTGKKSSDEGITDTYERYIRLGVLREGERLPRVRALAVKLGINPNTVEREYTELETRGLIRTIPKKGVYVLGSQAHSRLYEEARHQLSALKDAGLSRSEAREALEEVSGAEEVTGEGEGTM